MRELALIRESPLAQCQVFSGPAIGQTRWVIPASLLRHFRRGQAARIEQRRKMALVPENTKPEGAPLCMHEDRYAKTSPALFCRLPPRGGEENDPMHEHCRAGSCWPRLNLHCPLGM